MNAYDDALVREEIKRINDGRYRLTAEQDRVAVQRISELYHFMDHGLVCAWPLVIS